ncbi:MAG: GTP-binding protein [Promethearchaeota archaeon]|nr:MAG: GTP-binding protein [Candidatus Lokiarchaeota archaeon]
MKIVVTGAVQSGKSSYINFFDKEALNVQVKGQNNLSYTVAMDLGFVKINGFEVYLFGTPGLLRFRVMSEVVCRGADGFIFMFDAADPDKDGDAISILNIIRKSSNHDIPIVFLANKQDLENARSPEIIKAQNSLPEDSTFFSTSNKTGLNIEKSLRFVVNEIFDKHEELIQVLMNYENDIKGLAERLKKNKEQMKDFLNTMELKRFIEIDRKQKIYRVREGLKKVII